MAVVVNKVYISPLTASDAQEICRHLQEKEISDNTIRIPFPYTLKQAERWLEDNLIFEEENGIRQNFAIRNAEEVLMGVIGCHFNYGIDADKSEFGYWLGKNYWNQGIMTEAIQKFCAIAKGYYHFKTLEAHVFDFNITSQKVLLKTGFKEVEKLQGYHEKNGRRIDAFKFMKSL